MKTRAAVWMVMLVAGAARAEGGATPELTMAPGAKLWLEGNSTLHTFRADALTFRTNVAVSPEAGQEAAETLVRNQRVTGLELTVPVSALRSGEELLDENLRKVLKSEQFAQIIFRMDDYRVLPGSGPLRLEIRGRLTLAGVEKPALVTADASASEAGLRLSGRAEISMAEHGVQPPVLMLGMLKTDDRVVVRFTLELRRRGADARAAL